MAQVKEYARLTIEEIAALDKEKTIFFLAVSPLEAHGPHLPVGTDIFVAQELQRRYIAALQEEFPEYAYVTLPPLFAGADALPCGGSLSVPAPVLKGLLLAYARGLSCQGFKYLFLSDNHGGPRHQLGVESAARKANKKYGFHVIDPFGEVFRLMVEHDAEFLRETGLSPGCCGDDADAHAGTNETSLMLASFPHMVQGDVDSIPPSLPAKPSAALLFVAKAAGIFSPRLRGELIHLANTLAWVSSPSMLPYMGEPSRASKEAGEAMLQARVRIALQLFRRALSGEDVKITPLLWSLRILQRLPE